MRLFYTRTTVLSASVLGFLAHIHVCTNTHTLTRTLSHTRTHRSRVCTFYVSADASRMDEECVCTYIEECVRDTHTYGGMCSYMYVCARYTYMYEHIPPYVQTHSSIRKPPHNWCLAHIHVCTNTPVMGWLWCLAHIHVCTNTRVVGWLSYGGMCLYIHLAHIHVCTNTVVWRNDFFQGAGRVELWGGFDS